LRPAILDSLFAPVTALPGVGPQLGRLFERLAGPLVVDLLWHLPSGIVDRRAAPPIRDLQAGQIVTIRVQVEAHEAGMGRRPYRVFCADATGTVTLVYFNVKSDYLARLLPIGGERIVSGQVEFYNGMAQIPHPDLVLRPDELDRLKPIEPVYPLTLGLFPRVVQRAAAAALERAPELPEWIDPSLRERRGWPGWADALRRAHMPGAEPELSPSDPARERLAYDEVFASQLAVALVRARRQRRRGRAIVGSGALSAPVEAGLGFNLTGAQRMAVGEISAEMAQPRRMMRLLQGDVGSGKTVVALLAMATTVEAGAQVALMAPTELLARQHLKTITEFGTPAGLRIALLTGRERGREHAAIVDALAEGGIDILIGTQALFQEHVAFRDLGLVVIDEQHRFGVHQRLALQEKGSGRGAELLVMTATPIPRTLLLTSYGDMDVSRLDEKPPGRKPVATRTVPLDRTDEVIEGIARAVKGGPQVYWVCPLVAESEVLDIAAAEARHAELNARFGDKVGVVHGKLAGKDKDRVMAAFASGALSILVSTTVIEVGVDVPNASIMIIEHAERFGLAQLHQLRGRVGRGAKESSCILLYRQPLSDAARERLGVMRRTEDGFVIAEEDLKLRGGGEVLGTRQSGLPEFRVASLPEHEALLEAARDEARLKLAHDPDLKAPEAEPLRLLLYLFERDDAIKLMRAG